MSADLLSKLPLPLARVYLRALNARSPADRHMNAYYLMEAYIKTAVAVWGQSYVKGAAGDPRVDESLAALGMPSTGQWVGLLRELVGFFGRQEGPSAHPLKPLSATFSERAPDWVKSMALARAISEKDGVKLGFGAKMSPCDLFDILPAYRNKNLGHGAVALESVQERFGALLLEAAEELLDRADPMAGHEMVYVEEKRDLGGGSTRVDRLGMMGAMPMRMQSLTGPADVMVDWEAGGLYASMQNEPPLHLNPLMHATYEDEQAEVFYLNKSLRGGAVEYLNYSTGKVAKVQGVEGDLKRFLEWAGKKKAKDAAPPEVAKEDVAAGGEVIPFAKKRRRSVAVLGFKNSVGMPDTAWISTALSEMLTTELAVGEEFRMIPGESVARMKIELSLVEAESYSMETLTKIRTNLGCDIVILGSYLALGERAGGQIRLEMRVQDASAGEAASSVSETGNVADFFDFVSRSGKKLRDKLGIGELSEAQASQVRAAQPANAEAVRLYAEGLAKLRYFDALGAKELFEKAIDADPNYPLAHSALSAAWAALGYDENARAEAKQAYDLSEGLSREERLLVEGRYRETALEWDKVIDIHETLFRFSPDNLDYGLRLMNALSMAGKAKAAVEKAETLRKLPPPVCDDPRIDLHTSSAYKAMRDFVKSREFAVAAAKKAEEIGANILLAKARFLESFALGNLGMAKEAIAAAEESKELSEEAGDWNAVADDQNSAGLVLWRQGDLAKALRKFEGALGTFKKVGNKRGEASAYQNISLVMYKRGDNAESLKFSELALGAWREMGDKAGTADSLNNLGLLCFETGNLGRAKELYEESLAIREETGDRWGQGYLLNNLALILNEMGDYAGAVFMCESALEIFTSLGAKPGAAMSSINLGLALFNSGDLARTTEVLDDVLKVCTEIGEMSGKAYARSYSGNVLLERVKFAEAREALESAHSMRKGLGEKRTAAESLCDLARLGMAQQELPGAVKAASDAASDLESLAAIEEEAEAHCLLVQALVLDGRVEEAQAPMRRAWELLDTSDHPHFRLAVTTAEAILARASSDPEKVAGGLDAIESALAAAGSAAPLRTIYSALLAAGRLEIAAGRLPEARSRLEALASEASSKGFEWVASQASAELAALQGNP